MLAKRHCLKNRLIHSAKDMKNITKFIRRDCSRNKSQEDGDLVSQNYPITIDPIQWEDKLPYKR